MWNFLKWMFFYLFFMFLGFVLIGFSLGYSIYLTDVINYKIESYWWVAIMKNGELNYLENFIYLYQKYIFIFLYITLIFAFVYIAYVNKRKGFWLFVITSILFFLIILLNELSIFDVFISSKELSEQQINTLEIFNLTNKIKSIIRLALIFFMVNYLINTLKYFKKRIVEYSKK